MRSLGGFDVETDGLARTVGAVHLLLAGATNVATGATLAGAAASDRLLAPVVDGVGYVSPATALRYGNLLATLATDGALGAGLVLACLGLAACVGGFASRRGRPGRGVLALAVCNGVNPLALPLSFVAVALLAVSRGPSVSDGDVGDDRTAVDSTIAGGESADTSASGTSKDGTADDADDADYRGPVDSS